MSVTKNNFLLYRKGYINNIPIMHAAVFSLYPVIHWHVSALHSDLLTVQTVAALFDVHGCPNTENN